MVQVGNSVKKQAGEASPASEIAYLISNVLGRDGSPEKMTVSDGGLHPANAILNVLESEVEPKVRKSAQREIDGLANQVQRANVRPVAPVLKDVPEEPVPEPKNFEAPIPASANPFAPAPVAPKPITWLDEAIMAQIAQEGGKATWTDIADIEPEDLTAEINAFEPVEEHVSEPAREGAVILPFGDRREDQYNDDAPTANDNIEVAIAPPPPVASPASAGGGDNGWFGHTPEGLPVWLSTGVPVAAVSIFALGFVFMDRPAEIETITPSTTSSDDAAKLAALPIPQPEAVVTPEVAVASSTNIPDTRTLAEAAEDAPGAQPEIVPVRHTPSVIATGAAPAVFAAPAVSASIDDAVQETNLASAPSLKPQSLARSEPATRRVTSTVANVQAPAALKPRRVLPVRLFTGPMEIGSAASIVNAIAQQSGPTLNKSERQWLARDMERALDNEIDGRSVSLKSRQGQRVRVTLTTSAQVPRTFSITRASELASLPNGMVLEGGWYTARRDVMLHASPALNSGLSHRVLKRDALIERMATYTDRYGDRWYLMGQRGLAVGFISASDVALAATHNAAFGDVYAAPERGRRLHEARNVYTRCREGFVGPEGGLSQELKVCRDAKGHWVDHNEGQVATRRASLSGALMPKAGTASAIVLAEATGDPVAFHAFGNRKFRRRVQGDFVYARKGQTTEQTLPNGDLIRFTFGDTYQQEGTEPVMRVEALGAVPSRLQIKAGWMKAPIGAKLRARPDLLAQANLGEIPAGRSVETLGYVTGESGERWALVGRSGVGFGYMLADQLAPLEGRATSYAIANTHQRAIAELVDTVTTCRTVAYETIDAFASKPMAAGRSKPSRNSSASLQKRFRTCKQRLDWEDRGYPYWSAKNTGDDNNRRCPNSCQYNLVSKDNAYRRYCEPEKTDDDRAEK